MIGAIGVMLSLNDPRWGRGDGDQNNNGSGSRPNDPQRPSDGPPDLDQLWRDLNRRLSNMFGKGGRDGGSPPSGNGTSGGKGAGIGIGLILMVAVLIWLASGFYIVPEGQQAVIMTFGKSVGTSTRPGFQWRMPYPIQSHELVNISNVRTVEIGYRGNARSKMLQESLMLTDDENIIDIQFAVQYRIREDGAQDFVFKNRDPEDAVKQAAETAMREVVGKKTMDSIIYESRVDVATDVQKLMQTILDRYHTGVLVTSVAIQNTQPPEQVQAAFDDAVKAGQDRERQINEGQAYANDVIPKARGAASRLLQEAEGYRQRVIDSATGDASRFRSVLAEYNKAPGVTRDRMYIDTMQQVLQNSSKVLIDTKNSSPMLYMPLDQLLKQGGAESAAKAAQPAAGGAAPTATAPADTPAAAPTDIRSRDATRSRDRDAR
jgi:membrane protease subunit HflK